MASGIPKQRLAKAIIDTFSDARIRSGFNLLPTTNAVERLSDMRKDSLEEFLKSSTRGSALFKDLVERFPKNMPRTFFLVKLPPRKYTDELEGIVAKLAKKERENALFVNSKIRAVYLEDEGNIFGDWGLLEVPIAYERKLEYQIGDPPESERYAEFEQTYSLEHAFLWLLDDYSHGIVCCSDLAALQAILKYSREKLSLHLAVPNMTAEIFSRLIEKSETSSATFSGLPFEIPTVTVYARNVDQSDLYQKLEGDPDREQTAGFFRNNNGELFASFGISRRYARIWTPWHYSKSLLVAAGQDIIRKTDEELSTEFGNNYLNYLSYFSNVDVVVGDKTLNGKARETFQNLLGEILNSYQHRNEAVVDLGFIHELIEFQSKLDLQVAFQFECSNCGGGLGRCPDCLLPYKVKITDGIVTVACPRCKREVSLKETLICECGSEVELAELENHIQIYPGFHLIQSIDDFVNQNLEEFNWQGVFVVEGLILKLFEKRFPKEELPGMIRLDQLGLWQEAAKYPNRRAYQKHLSLLGMTKEKCRRNGSPPTIQGCEECKATMITEKQIRKRKEVCLPRVFGLPIGKEFDGIHHGYEIADIKYEDSYNGTAISLGIHLKSRTTSRPLGLGKSVYPIKSLYTQSFYSAYQVFKGDADFDVIGISIPNTVKKEVVESIQMLLNKLGYSLLVIDENEWLKIFDAALETVAFEEAI
jgi:hypothetical protein